MRTCVLDLDLYPVEAVDLAEAAFRALCSVTKEPEAGRLRILIEPVPTAPAETVDEFLNFALCAALERHFTA